MDEATRDALNSAKDQRKVLFADVKDHEKRLTLAEAYIERQEEKHDDLKGHHETLHKAHTATKETTNKKIEVIMQWIFRLSVIGGVAIFLADRMGLWSKL